MVVERPRSRAGAPERRHEEGSGSVSRFRTGARPPSHPPVHPTWLEQARAQALGQARAGCGERRPAPDPPSNEERQTREREPHSHPPAALASPSHRSAPGCAGKRAGTALACTGVGRAGSGRVTWWSAPPSRGCLAPSPPPAGARASACWATGGDSGDSGRRMRPRKGGLTGCLTRFSLSASMGMRVAGRAGAGEGQGGRGAAVEVGQRRGCCKTAPFYFYFFSREG